MLIDALNRAWDQKQKNKYERIYIAIDLHGVVFKNTYDNNKIEIYDEAILPLQYLSKREGIKLIAWTSTHADDWYGKYSQLLRFNDITFDCFNSNCYEQSNEVSDFSSKFYFSVLLDDKAGFDPITDWETVYKFFRENK